MKYIGKVLLKNFSNSNQNHYSDGDIEAEMLEIVKNNEDMNEVIQKDNRWPILYHFSPIRKQIIAWMSFPIETKVLEIGAGCGAITGELCEKATSVTAVELSERRADIIANRYQEKDNLEIYVGNLNDINFGDTKYDIVTLIGVLEYAGKFTSGTKPYHSFLSKIKGLLKENGQLIIAIENKYGLKYWSGSQEDHTGIYFDGIENYPSNQGVRTFGKAELKDLLDSVGFYDQKYYYPLPDYKMPEQIFSEDHLPQIGDINQLFQNYDSDKLGLYNDKAVYEGLIKEKQFEFFSNSFLVVCKYN